MAFVLTRPSSPVAREHAPQIGTDNGPLHLPHASQAPAPSNLDHDMPREKDRPHIEVILDTPHIVLKGTGNDVEPARLSGHVALNLTESTSIKEITLQFRGKARLPMPSSEVMSLNSSTLTYVVCTHDWSFLEGEKTHSHTLKAGRHLFPFQLRIGGSLPSTVSTPAFGGASVMYKLRTQAVRSAFSQNLQAVLPVPIIRSFAAEALEYQQTLEIENTWPDKLMYSVMVPHKAWAAGDKLTALVKFSPLAKGVCVLNVNTSVHEQTRVYTRTGAQEHSRVVASVKHEVVNGKAVEVETTRSGRFAPSHFSSPGSPYAGFVPTRRSTSSNSSGTSRNYFSLTPNYSSTPPTPQTPPHVLEPGPSAPTDHHTESEHEDHDVVTYLNLLIPLSITPTHSLEPITVSHRIRWSILILNLDGHTSELRCSLPLHLLDYRLLGEARAFSAATRRLLLGGSEVPALGEEDDRELPSYKSHVRDRVANMFLPESATMRVTNPWVNQASSPTYPHDNSVHQSPWHAPRSGISTPLDAHLLSHLPHAPGSGTSTPLDWVNSELLLSLSDDARPALSRGSRSPSADLHSGSDSPSHMRGRPGSRSLSGFSSRAPSPERHSSGLDTVASASGAGPGRTYVHSGHASRNLHSLLNTTMKPFSSFSPNNWMHFSSTAQPEPPSGSDVYDQQAQPRTVSLPGQSSGPALLHRAFTEVPDYAIASRGFIGGVPPLTSMWGLPSYEETQRAQSDSDLAARFARRAGQASPAAGMRLSPPIS